MALPAVQAFPPRTLFRLAQHPVAPSATRRLSVAILATREQYPCIISCDVRSPPFHHHYGVRRLPNPRSLPVIYVPISFDVILGRHK